MSMAESRSPRLPPRTHDSQNPPPAPLVPLQTPTRHGEYTAKPNLNVGLEQMEAEAEHTRRRYPRNPPMDALTKRLALYVEGAFSRVRATTDAEGRAMNVSYSRLRVLRMSASFLVDSSGALWFTHCGDAVTQSLAPPAPDPATVAAIAAETAASAEAELRNLIRAA